MEKERVSQRFSKSSKNSRQLRWVQQGHGVLEGLEDPGNIKRIWLLSSCYLFCCIRHYQLLQYSCVCETHHRSNISRLSFLPRWSWQSLQSKGQSSGLGALHKSDARTARVFTSNPTQRKEVLLFFDILRFLPGVRWDLGLLGSLGFPHHL